MKTVNQIIDEINSIGFSNFLAKNKGIASMYWQYPYSYDKEAEVFYCLYHNVSPPLCSNGNKKTFIDFSKGYRQSSCFLVKDKKCNCFHISRSKISKKIHSDTNKNKKALQKRKNTNLKKYGVDNPFKSNEIKEKIKKTNLKKYGVDNPSKSSEIQRKVKKTIFDRYGSENLFDNKIIKEKRNQTNLTKYGGISPFSSGEIRKKAKISILKKYGVDNIFKSNYFKQLNKMYLMNTYGVQNISARHLSNETKTIIYNKDLFCDFVTNKSYALVASQLKMSATQITEIAKKFESIPLMSINMGSTPQKEISNFLDDFSITNQQNRRDIIKPKEIDIFLPDFNIGIEYHGLYWHTSGSGNKDNNYHKNKLLECNNQGIDLIQIFSDEWENKQDIVKSIIKSKLSLNDKIYARKTIIKEISEKESKIFLEENHLQGNVIGSTKRYGLFYNEILVSVMTFQLKNNIWELKRYANKLNTNIVGGASRLFSHFIKENNPEEIFSYCDLRYFNGGVYRSLGFDLDSITKPGYFYVKNNQRYHRLNFTKKKLVDQGHDPNKTEKEIMSELGYDVIYDCGHSKWVWRK